LAPFTHGALAHSSTASVSHDVPLKPAAHVHSNASAVTFTDVNESAQAPPFEHGALAHSSTSVSHTDPTKPAAHVHAKASTDTAASPALSLHAPPFWHGKLAHSSMSTSHAPPTATEHDAMIPALTVDEQTPFVYPAAHEHENASAGTDADDAFDSLHTAPFTHGYEPHSSMSTPQLSPVHPPKHRHDHSTTQLALVHAPSRQLPPFSHGLLSHSAIAMHVVPLSTLAYPGLHRHS